MHEQEMLQIWGKTAEKTGARRPLLFHMLDGAAVAGLVSAICIGLVLSGARCWRH